jgi:NAD(P)-dependent dehydrogenase (short-subunit alcohol dehydrogenase family)
MFGSLDNFRAFAKPLVPSGAPGHVDDIAEAVLYLASPESRFVVGQVLAVDGGATAR